MKIKAVIEFEYDSTEDISDWGLEDCSIEKVDTPEKAVEVVRAELNTHSSWDFIIKAWSEDENGHVVNFTKG